MHKERIKQNSKELQWISHKKKSNKLSLNPKIIESAIHTQQSNLKEKKTYIKKSFKHI